MVTRRRIRVLDDHDAIVLEHDGGRCGRRGICVRPLERDVAEDAVLHRQAAAGREVRIAIVFAHFELAKLADGILHRGLELENFYFLYEFLKVGRDVN